MVVLGAVAAVLVVVDRGGVPSLLDTERLHRRGRRPHRRPRPRAGRERRPDRRDRGRAGLPARAASIALATAYQESKLRNLDDGDRDSLGLFQQRPSQGWGTEKQMLDPDYATNAFYDALAKVDGYREMEITEAAQAVQRSGLPEAYADHEEDARALASALTGNSPAGRSAATCPATPTRRATRWTTAASSPRASVVRQTWSAVFGELSLGGFAPGGVTTGHMEGSAHYEGRAIDVFVRPISAENKQRGWAIATTSSPTPTGSTSTRHLRRPDLAARARARTTAGATTACRRPRGGDPRILEHRDHVHVDVVD